MVRDILHDFDELGTGGGKPLVCGVDVGYAKIEDQFVARLVLRL